jgi:undecaprenyl diphosphate synthase
VATVRRVVERAVDVGVQRLTLYAFSSDNWRRPAAEVQSIFWLLRAFLRLDTERLRRRGVRLQVIGRRDRLSDVVLREIEKAEAATRNGEGLHLRVAIDYSSRDAITRAAAQLLGAGSISLEGLTQALGAEVDLLIRTGGETRLSDFLLWECAYAELLFTEQMWPDFDAGDLDAALTQFRKRERRFGGVPAVAG